MNIEINVSEIDLDTVIAKTVAYDEDGDSYTTGSRTLADHIARNLVERIVHDHQYGQSLRERVQTIRDEEIRALLKPILAEAVAAPIQKTNAYGEQVGAPTTLREIVIDEARKVMKEPRDSYRSKASMVTEMVRAEVEAAFKAEIAAEVQRVRDAVLEEIGGQVSEQVQGVVRAALAKAVR